MDIARSDIVKSAAGRDRGRLFFVLGTEGEFLLLAGVFLLFRTPGDPTTGQVIGRHLHRHLVTRQNSDEIHPLPKDKRIEIGLTYIYGIGRKSAKDILATTGINPDTRVKDLTGSGLPSPPSWARVLRSSLLVTFSPLRIFSAVRPSCRTAGR